MVGRRSGTYDKTKIVRQNQRLCSVFFEMKYFYDTLIRDTLRDTSRYSFKIHARGTLSRYASDYRR